MAGWLHGFCVGASGVFSPQCGFSLSLFCNYYSWTAADLAAARADRTRRTRFGKAVPDHAAFRCVQFAVDTCGFMGKGAVQFVILPGNMSAECGRIRKGEFVSWENQLLSETVKIGDAEK